MLEKNKISVLTKMMGIGEEKASQLIVPQNSLTNFHARLGLTEKSLNVGSNIHGHAPSISCPHCQNMAKNFLYLESLIRANCSPKNKCSLCSSTLRYVEYVNKSILDVFAKNVSIMEAAKKYSNSKPRFRMPKLMSDVSRLTGGSKKVALTSNDKDIDSGTAKNTIMANRGPRKSKSKAIEILPGRTAVLKPKQQKITDKVIKHIKAKGVKSVKDLSKSSLKTSKHTGSRFSARGVDPFVEHGFKVRKLKVTKIKKNGTAAMATKKNGLKAKSRQISTVRTSQPESENGKNVLAN